MANQPTPMIQVGPPQEPEQKRGSERVLLRIPIRVEGIEVNSKPFEENTSTLVINRNGALIKLKHSVGIESQVSITNLQNRVSCQFRWIGSSGNSLADGPEWRVECLKPDLNFWGIVFPEIGVTKVAAPANLGRIDALLDCSMCRLSELAQLTAEQYRSLSEQASMRRLCPRCNATTSWSFKNGKDFTPNGSSAQEFHDGEKTSRIRKTPRARRMMIKLPIRIRRRNGGEDVTRTENLSKTGVCFISNQVMNVGETVMLTVGFDPGKNETEVSGRVVWRCQLASLTGTIYGLHLE